MTTALFTPCRSCTMCRPTLGGALATGKSGVLTGKSLHSLITQEDRRDSTIGVMPASASGLS